MHKNFTFFVNCIMATNDIKKESQKNNLFSPPPF